MKSLRKSLNGNKEPSSKLQISTPLPTMSKPATAMMPPQKVIRALSTYKSQAPQQLSFEKGEFFYVLKDGQDAAWYEAHNPVSGARGIVPRAMFEEFGKSAPSARHSQFNSFGGPGMASPGAPSYPASAPASAAPPKHQVYYAIVMHDFNAERPDELDARRGDAITVVAQSNREWFVAKPIGKLGRPGLIPVSFVEIHDPTTGKAIVDLNALMDKGDLPKVEEWKRAMLTYKQNSISLGVIDPPTMGDSPNSFLSQMQRDLPPPPPEKEEEFSAETLPEGILLAADVVSFHYEMEEYWFRVDAVFQPYAPPGQPLPPAKQLILFRIYEDFYEFQVTLLHTFPREAGQEPPYPRILPFMPGPAKDVDDALTATRKDELNEYIHGLCSLAYNGGRQILEHDVLRQFLALKPGDVMHETDPRFEDMEALNDGHQSSNGNYPGQDYPSDVADNLGRMQLQDNRRNSDGSEYEDEGYAPSPQPRSYDKHPYGQSLGANGKINSRDDSLRVQAHTQNHHQRSGSSTSFHTQPYTSSHSRSQSRERLSPRVSPNPPSAMPRYVQENGHSQQSTPSTSSFRSSSQTNSRSRSQSNATMNNFNNPSISASNPQTAFVKIKIFDRVADDLIAIRVHPKVSHSELMDKVQSRLGNDCRVLKYRDSLTNTFVGLDTDDELRAWMEGTDKHVLYAD